MQLLYCALWSREVRQRDKSTAHARVQRGKPRNSLGGDEDQARGETRGRQRVEKEQKMLQPVQNGISAQLCSLWPPQTLSITLSVESKMTS